MDIHVGNNVWTYVWTYVCHFLLLFVLFQYDELISKDVLKADSIIGVQMTTAIFVAVRTCSICIFSVPRTVCTDKVCIK